MKWQIDRFNGDTLRDGLNVFRERENLEPNRVYLEQEDYLELFQACPDIRSLLVMKAIRNEDRGLADIMRYSARTNPRKTLRVCGEVNRWEGFEVYDAFVQYQCGCCKGPGVNRYVNITRASYRRILNLDSAEGPEAYRKRATALRVNACDSYNRLAFAERQGCYSPEGDWLPYPVGNLEIQDRMADLKQASKRKSSQNGRLVFWFVDHILKRPMNQEDYGGMHAKHAKELLSNYSVAEICGCLDAINDGLFGDVDVTYMTIVKTFEPSLFQQYRDYLKTPPPVYLETEMAQWEERRSRTYREVEFGIQAAPIEEYE